MERENMDKIVAASPWKGYWESLINENTADEWMRCDRGIYIFKDGLECIPDEFWENRQSKGWEDGWSVICENRA